MIWLLLVLLALLPTDDLPSQYCVKKKPVVVQQWPIESLVRNKGPPLTLIKLLAPLYIFAKHIGPSITHQNKG